jgi:hypothetical protein
MDKFKNFRRTDISVKPLRMGRGRHPYHSLPFVGKGGEASFWALPATGGYFGGYKAGEAMALAFVKATRDRPDVVASTFLTTVAEAFMCRFEEEGGIKAARSARASNANDGMPALRGQWAGFFNTLHHWLAISAKQLGGGLDAVSMQRFVDDANDGLGFDMAAYMKSLYSGEGDA